MEKIKIYIDHIFGKKVAKLAHFDMSGGYMSWRQSKVYNIKQSDQVIKKDNISFHMTGDGYCESIITLSQLTINKMIQSNSIGCIPNKGRVIIVKQSNGKFWCDSQTFD